MEGGNVKIKICPYSGEEFFPKRQNQKFAQPNYRIAFHNEKYNKIRKDRLSVDKQLHKNYSILLLEMLEETKKVFHKQYLLGKGFSFGVLTHYQKIDKVNRQALYDFLIISEEDKITIINYKK